MLKLRAVVVILLFCVTSVCAAPSGAKDSLSLRITSVDISQFPIVQLKVEVSRNGLLQRALSSGDFELREDLIMQRIDALVCPGDSITRMSVALLLDRSGSMAQDQYNRPDPLALKLNAAKKAISTFLSFLDNRDEACLYSFSSGSNAFQINQNFTRDTAAIRRQLPPILANGGTAIWQSMMRTIDSLKSRAGRKVLICLTDGKSQGESSLYTSKKVIDKATKEKVPCYMIGLGSDVDASTLQSIANSTGGKYYFSPGPAELEGIFRALANDIISDACILRYTSTNPCQDGSERAIELKLRAGALMATADTVYRVPNNRTPITLFFEAGTVVPSKSQFRIPLSVLEPLSMLAPLSYRCSIGFDSTLLTLQAVESAGTVSEGAAMLVTRVRGGFVRIEVTNHLPTMPSGPLFELVFASGGTAVDTVTGIVVTDASLQQQCPVALTTGGASVLLQACQERFRIGSVETIVPQSGGNARVPVRVEPAIAAFTRFDLHFSVTYDTAVMRFVQADAAGTLAAGAALVATPIKGSVVLDLHALAADSTGIACWLVFAPNNLKRATASTVHFDALFMRTGCAVQTGSEDPTVLLDGRCERLIAPVGKLPAISGHPNPFNPGTTLDFSIPSTGAVTVRILDAAGRDVALLASGDFEAGKYRIPFNAAGLPSGTYRAVLHCGSGTATVPLVLLK